MTEPEDYEHLNVTDLKELAKDNDLEGYSTLNKGPLCELHADNDTELPDEYQDESDGTDDEEEFEEESDDEEEDLVQVRVHAGHPDSYEFLDEHLDHEIQDYKRYTLDLPQSKVDELLEEIGQPFVTPLA